MQYSQLTCPFCKAANCEIKVTNTSLPHVYCPSCHASGPVSDTDKEAITKWAGVSHEANLLKMIVDESHNVILVKDWDGRFIFGNKALAKVYGTTTTELIGRFDHDFNPNKEQVEFYLQSSREVMLAGKTRLIEESATDSDTGETRHYLSIKKPFRTSSGDHRILIIANDITELKSAYLQLKEREKRYDYAMNIAGEGIWDWDIRNNTVTHNMRWCEILGLNENDLTHPVEFFIQLLHEDHRESVLKAVDKALADKSNQTVYEHEHRMRKANGEECWVYDRGYVVERDEKGEPLRMVGSIRDINKQKHYESKLSSAQEELFELNKRLEESLQERTAELNSTVERFALAIQSTDDGLWDWDLETNQVSYSSRWKGMLGFKDEELESTLDSWANLVHPDDKEMALTVANEYIQGHRDIYEVEMRMRHKNGHYVFVRSRGFKMLSPKTNEPLRLIGTHVDITDKKRAEVLKSRTTHILELIATGESPQSIYDEIAHLYESRHPNMRCSVLELEGSLLRHCSAPNLPQEYCDVIDGIEHGPMVGSCGAATYTRQRVLVEDIATDPRWNEFKHHALKHGLRSCWSEPIISSGNDILGAFAMYYDQPRLPTEEEISDITDAARLTSIVMEREINLQRIRSLAYTDSLTELSSRAAFYIHLDYRLKLSVRNKHRFSLLYLDLDNFKTVNDSLGHHAGDLLLKEVAVRIKTACREADFIGRLGGDEFCIVLHDIVTNQYSENVAQRCLRMVAVPYEIEGRKVNPSCSIGIAHYPQDGQDIHSLIKAADTALYEAKNLGKNQHASYIQELSDRAEHRFKVEQYLREDIEQQNLTLVFQPQVNMKTDKLIGIEALSRWHHKDMGQVPPSHFIEVAEHIGLIKTYSEWVIKEACKQTAEWSRLGHKKLRIAINITPDHFLDEDLAVHIKEVLAETQLDAAQIVLEVTESAIQTRTQNLSAFKSLKDIGLKIAIDDFGSGYSSFASLKHLNVDVLKIDKHFIDDILTCSKSRLLVNSMIEMGHNLGYVIVAEGIESAEQYQMLKQMDCDIGQGYLFSKPIPASELGSLLTNNSFTSEFNSENEQT